MVLYLHGDQPLREARESVYAHVADLAVNAQSSVLLARYRPEWPLALDDVLAAYEYCRARGPVAVIGRRLGAGLAAALLLHLRDAMADAPLCAVLISALLDCAPGGAVSSNSRASLLDTDLRGLPPVRMLSAGCDPLLDDSLAFGARAARFGVIVETSVQRDIEALLRTGKQTREFIQTWSTAA
jgi:acetyl esterase/lipase